ncbi:MAG TPA: response regulator [Verrucomicrobiales bacterium]|nr:response regulator [Verrucomicrobiales bacterium]
MTSIRIRLLLVLLAVGLIPMLIVMLVTNYQTRESLELSEREKIAAVTYEVARQARLVMASATNDLVALQGNRIVTDSSIPMNVRVEEMRRLVAAYKMFDDITLYDSRGLIVRSTTSKFHPEPEEKTLWFKDCIVGQKVVTSRPHHVENEDGLHLKVYIPLSIANSDESFVLRARLRFDPMWNLIEGIKIGERGQALLLDPRGRLIAGRDKEKISRPYFKGGVTPFWGQNKGFVKIKGEEFYFQSEVLPKRDTGVGEAWVIACLRPRAEVLASVKQAVNLQSRIAFAVFILTGLIGVWLAKMISNPIVNASAIAHKVEEGDLSVRMQEEGATEIKQLGVSFNAMIDQVKNHRDGLEAIVNSRTEKLRLSQKELERTYAQLRASYEAARDGILLVGKDGSLIATNQRVIDYFQLTEGIDQIDMESFERQLSNQFANGKNFIKDWKSINKNSLKTADLEWVLNDPVERVLSVYSSPVLISGGRQIARFWSFHDVTEQRKLQKGLEQAQKMEAVGRLAGGVAHDFNNLLTGIIGNLSLVEAGDDERDVSKNKEFISSAKRASQRAAELVKQLLGFSRQSHLELDCCEVNQVLEDVHSLLKSTTDPAISISMDCSDDLWTIEADSTQVEQVVMNMCVNAIDAMSEREGDLVLATANKSLNPSMLSKYPGREEGDFIEIKISDNGIGMPSDVMAKLFEPFFTTKEQGKGTGLGLATSYGIVKQHGGWIECESEVGVGSNFSIFLPRKDVRNENLKPLANEDDTDVNGTETILVVDDEDLVRRVAEEALKCYGYSTFSACNGKEALKVLEENQDEIMLVLLDLTMPVMSGKETLAVIRERFTDVPVVVCSGYMVDLEGFEDETGLRPDSAIQKPYNVNDLAKRVREVLDGTEAPLIA